MSDAASQRLLPVRVVDPSVHEFVTIVLPDMGAQGTLITMNDPKTKRELRDAALAAWFARRNGVAHTSDARAAGFSGHEIRRLVMSGGASRERRSWLVAPGVPFDQVAATRVGGRLTCVSAAKRNGWWVPDFEDIHVAVTGNASRLDSCGLRVHWAVAPAPVGHTTVEEPVVNVLFQVARCLPPADGLAVWESAIRVGAADPRMLARVAWRNDAAARFASLASTLSDSGLETRFLSGMRSIGVEVRQQVLIDGRPVDGLIGRYLVVQLDGFAHHSSAADRRRDIAADAQLALLGYTVLRFDYAQVFFDWEYVQTTIQLAIAQRLHQHPRPGPADLVVPA